MAYLLDEPQFATADGASGTEVAALHAFRADSRLQTVCASTIEVYVEHDAVPAGARVHFDGVDSRAGRLVKYATVEPAAGPYADA